MTQLQLELTRLIGKKEFIIKESTWSGKQIKEEESIPATLSDFHRWMNEKWIEWSQCGKYVNINDGHPYYDVTAIPYDSSKYLLDQEPETLEKIISLITSNQ